MRRFVPLVAIAVILAGLLWDPYTWAYDGSDAIRPAPLWQSAFAILDVSILFALVALSIRGKLRSAAVLALFEAAYYFAGNMVLYLRDGSARFVHGFGAESNLTEHVVVVAVRFLLIGYLAVVSSKPIVS
jgi:hypothetical protein